VTWKSWILEKTDVVKISATTTENPATA